MKCQTHFEDSCVLWLATSLKKNLSGQDGKKLEVEFHRTRNRGEIKVLSVFLWWVHHTKRYERVSKHKPPKRSLVWKQWILAGPIRALISRIGESFQKMSQQHDRDSEVYEICLPRQVLARELQGKVIYPNDDSWQCSKQWSLLPSHLFAGDRGPIVTMVAMLWPHGQMFFKVDGGYRDLSWKMAWKLQVQ